MTDELLSYYNRELAILRSMAADFARRHDRVASRLGLGAQESADPHVERLLQGVAFLNARLRRKLDDDFPELAEAILDIVYPHYVRPIPSMSIVQFQLDPGQSDAAGGYDIPAGTTLESEPEPHSGVRCRFRTAYPVKLWPLRVETVELLKRPFRAPQTPRSQVAQAALRIRLKTFSPGTRISELNLRSLRFYLHAGPAANVNRLYELLMTKSLEICLAATPEAKQFQLMPPSALEPVGFARLESILPFDDRSFTGYRLLTEYFAFPQKFLFLDLVDLKPRLQTFDDAVEIFIFLDAHDENLQRHLSADTLRLGATPIVNLFSKKAEPFLLDQRQTEYLVEPDARSSAGHEVYSIDQVELVSPDGEALRCLPFYACRHGQSQGPAFWHAHWRTGQRSAQGGSEFWRDVFLSFVNLDARPAQPADWTVRVQTTCVNRDLPGRLPSGYGRPQFDLPEGRGAVESVTCLHHPTPTLRPDLGRGLIWRLISHLALNRLSLSSPDAAAALKEILLLYDFRQSATTRGMIQSIRSIQTRRVTRRIGKQLGGFGRGIRVELQLDESKFSDGGAYLFASVLDRFFGLYANINSFTETQVQCHQRREQEHPWTWPMRSGEQVLL